MRTLDSEVLATIYITNHNYERFVKQAIDSALQQTFDDYEVIVIDDGSTDNSRAVISPYIGHPKVRVIFQENKGLNATNNVAVRAARGKYVMRLDADDFLDENALLVMTRILESDARLAMVFPDYYYVDANGVVNGQERRLNFEKDVTLHDQPAHGACSLIRRDCLLEVGAYSEDFRCQDGYEVWLKLIARYPVRNVNTPLFYYRRHGNNLTEKSELLLSTRSEIIRAHADRLERPNLHTAAVLPVRGKAIDPKCMSMVPLGGKPVIDWTIAAALGAGSLSELIVTSPDEALLAHVETQFGNKVTIWRRERAQAQENVPFYTSVTQALEHRRRAEPLDAVVGLTIEAPFRSSLYIDKAVNVMRIFEVDVVLGILPESDHFYQHHGQGLRPVGHNGNVTNLRLERDYLYRECGGIHLVRYDHYVKNQNLLSGRVGQIVLSRKAAMKVRDHFELRLAQAVLDWEAEQGIASEQAASA